MKEKETVVFATISVLFLLLLCAQTGEQEKKRSKKVLSDIPNPRGHYPQAGITSSLQCIDFSIVSCRGDSTQETVSIDYLLFTKGATKKVAMLSNDVRAIDNRGTACPVEAVSLNLNTTSGCREDAPNSSPQFKGKLILKNVSPKATSLAYISVGFLSEGIAAGSAEDYGVVEIRALAIDWPG